jgi:copper chaperone CopZ
MKEMTIAALIAALTLAMAGPAPAQTPATPAPPGDSLRLEVDGMVCSLCAYGVERRLKKVEHVEAVRVELDSALVVLTLRPGTAVSDSVLTAEVRRAGFTLRGVTRFQRGRAEGNGS